MDEISKVLLLLVNSLTSATFYPINMNLTIMVSSTVATNKMKTNLLATPIFIFETDNKKLK